MHARNIDDILILNQYDLLLQYRLPIGRSLKKKPSELFILTNELKNTDKNWIRFIFKYACIYYTFFFRKKIPSLLLYSFFFLNWKSAYIYSQFEVLCGYKIYKEKICMKEGTSITFIDWRKIIWFIPYWFLKKCWIVLCL